MRHHYLAVVSTVAALALGAGVAQGRTIAGWDFSQYRGAGSMTVDNSTFVDTLSANYSAEDGSFGAGSGAAAFGTLYMNGTGGSSNITPGFGTGDVQPVAADVTANINAPTLGVSAPIQAYVRGTSSFNTFAVLDVEGQLNEQLTALGAIANSPAVVFEADLSSLGVGNGGTQWSVSFGGLTRTEAACDDGNPGTTTDCDASVTVEYELDGGGYSTASTVTLTPTEQQFSVPLDLSSAQVARVRLTLDTTAGRPIIDNVSVEAQYVPEPTLAWQLGAGALGLVALSRRRRA